MRALITRLPAVLTLVHCGLAGAEPWGGVRPGSTREPQVLRLFGEPSQRRAGGDERVLTYEGEAAPAGARRADFRLEPRTGRLRRIDVLPEPRPSRAEVERGFGPACPRTGRAKAPCYEVKVSSFNEPYFHYASRGVAVFFSRGEVRAISYLPPARGRRALAGVEPPDGMDAPEPAGSAVAGTEDPGAPPARAAGTEDPGAPPARAAGTALDAPEVSQEDPAVGSAPSTLPPVPELAVAIIEGEGDARPPEDTPPSPVVVEVPGERGTVSGPESTSTSGPRPLTDPDEGAERYEAFSKERLDLLTFGAFYFQRAEVSGARRSSDDATALQPIFPGLLDVYLDFKPLEGMRSFAVGRLAYDPLDPNLSTPRTSLDRLWIYFGLFDHVFISAGRQYIKWGSSRVWNTTDFLRDPNPDPLGVFDLRQGVDMVKVNVPWESMASNLWLIATAEQEAAAQGPASIRYGGAVRAELTLGTSELIATASFLERRRPRYGLDYSLGVSIFDFNAEVALLRDWDARLWERSGEGFVERPVQGTQVQASGGVSAQLRVADVYRTVIRLEGLYNQVGYSDRRLLTWTQSTGDFRPLYAGRLYGMAQVAVTARNVYEPTVSLTVLGNVSDPSFLARLDFNASRMRDVIVAGFVEMPFGERGGEFRFQPDPSVANLPATDLGLFRAGINLRLRM